MHLKKVCVLVIWSTEAGQKKVNTVTEFQEQVATAIEGGRKTTMLLLVRRAGDPRFLALTVQD